MLVWAIDIGDWPLALELGDHVLAANLGLPERYKRSPAVLLAEIAESALRVATAVPRAVLEETLALTADHDMPDQVRAKLHTGLAFQAEAEAFDPEAESQRAGGKRALVDAALDHTSRALVLDQHAGVKKVIERLNADLKKLPEASAALTPPRSRPMRHPRRGRNGREASAPRPRPHPPPLGHPFPA
jgi:hypothetical protein